MHDVTEEPFKQKARNPETEMKKKTKDVRELQSSEHCGFAH